jgi:hypothetical protein
MDRLKAVRLARLVFGESSVDQPSRCRQSCHSFLALRSVLRRSPIIILPPFYRSKLLGPRSIATICRPTPGGGAKMPERSLKRRHRLRSLEDVRRLPENFRRTSTHDRALGCDDRFAYRRNPGAQVGTDRSCCSHIAGRGDMLGERLALRRRAPAAGNFLQRQPSFPNL